MAPQVLRFVETVRFLPHLAIYNMTSFNFIKIFSDVQQGSILGRLFFLIHIK